MKKFNTFNTALFAFSLMTVAFFAFMGCEGKDEPIPAYIHINDFVVEATNLDLHGSVSQKITEAMVFLIDKNSTEAPHALGTVTLPAVIPAIVHGEFEINIDPVVRASGNSLYLELYPFYERYTSPITLGPNEDVTVNPKTRYSEAAKFLLIENFENSSHIFDADRDGDMATSLDISDMDVFEGSSSGRVRLDTASSVFVAANSIPYQILMPDAGKVFMEVNYKTDVPLEFGFLAISGLNDETPRLEFVVFANEEWNKIYFDMTQLIAQAPEERFVFVVRGGIPIEEGAFTLNEAFVYLDNIKVITF